MRFGRLLSIKTAIFMDKVQLLMGLSIETAIFMDKSRGLCASSLKKPVFKGETDLEVRV